MYCSTTSTVTEIEIEELSGLVEVRQQLIVTGAACPVIGDSAANLETDTAPGQGGRRDRTKHRITSNIGLR